MYRQLIILRRKCIALSIPSCYSPFSTASSNAFDVSTPVPSQPSEKMKKISRAMVAYMEQVKARDIFIKKETAEYELGKRHLANMMGLDANTMTKEDVNRAITYLFPSNLFSPRSLPTMKSPEDLYPPQKPVQFNVDGRPYHSMFFTRFPNFYQILFDIRSKIQKLQAYEDAQVAKGASLPAEKLSLPGTDWLNVTQLSALTLEDVTEDYRAQLVAAGDDLLSLPFSFLEAEFIKKYRAPVGAQVGKELEDLREQALATMTTDENGRQTVTATGVRKRVACTVKLTDGGSGKILIDGQTMDAFDFSQSRESVLFPFVLLNRVGQFDVESTHLSLTGRFKRSIHNPGNYGESVLAGGTRHGISLALLAFVSPEEVEKMRLAGLLTRDLRRRERKKIGQPGARAKWIWRKR